MYWVRQDEFPSRTPRALTRTRYLAPLRGLVAGEIARYFSAHPNGEDVTLAVLRMIGPGGVRRAAAGRSVNTVKQDIGLFVAQTLVELYGETRVHTLRLNDRATVASNRTPLSGPAWVKYYARHSVTPASP